MNEEHCDGPTRGRATGAGSAVEQALGLLRSPELRPRHPLRRSAYARARTGCSTAGSMDWNRLT